MIILYTEKDIDAIMETLGTIVITKNDLDGMTLQELNVDVKVVIEDDDDASNCWADLTAFNIDIYNASLFGAFGNILKAWLEVEEASIRLSYKAVYSLEP